MMKIYSIIASVFFIFLFSNCSGEERSDEQIAYSELPEITINLITEAGESESYFPGQLNELYVSSDGSILVSDWGSITLEQFTPEGEYLQTVATEGGGPGELSSFFFIKDAGQEQLIVEHQGSRRDFFEPGENGIYRYSSTISQDQNDQYGFHLIGHRPDDGYYVSPRNVIRDVEPLITNPQDYRNYPIQLIDLNMPIVEDSLQILQGANAHIMRMNGGFRVSPIPYRNTDNFLVRPDGTYLVSRPGDSKIEFYGLDHELEREVYLDVEPRPVTSSDLEYAFRDLDRDMRSEVEPRVHDIKPPFLEVWVTESRLWLHTDKREDGNEFVILDLQGDPIGRFQLAEFDEVKKVIENRVYTIHKNPDVGDSVRVYEIEV